MQCESMWISHSYDSEACLGQKFKKLTFVISHQISAHWTFAIWPAFVRSSQFASYSLGPIRKLRSVIFSSSLTKVAVNPSLQCDFVRPITYMNTEVDRDFELDIRYDPGQHWLWAWEQSMRIVCRPCGFYKKIFCVHTCLCLAWPSAQDSVSKFAFCCS